MIKHYITHQYEETKKKNIELYMLIFENGKHIKSEWQGDYWVATYEYNNKIYELWENMEYGIMSCVVEYNINEYKK